MRSTNSFNALTKGVYLCQAINLILRHARRYEPNETAVLRAITPSGEYSNGGRCFFGSYTIRCSCLLLLRTGAPNISQSALESDTSTKIYDSNNDVISRSGAQNRDYVKSKNIPEQLKSAVVSIEDRRFYKNHGVDPIRIVSAAMHNVTGSSLGLQGGSTLTQQLVKLSVFSTAQSDQTLKRKSQEAWLAIKVDQTYSKQQILEFYINKVYMGNGVYGMQTAAHYYYGKSLSKLNLQQMAMLAGMPQSPTNYDPIHHPQYAKYRRDQEYSMPWFLTKSLPLVRLLLLKQPVFKLAWLKRIPLARSIQLIKKYIDAYLKEVYAELKSEGYNTNTDGLRVYTNLNMSAQKHLYSIANSNYVAYPSNKFQMGATMVDFTQRSSGCHVGWP